MEARISRPSNAKEMASRSIPPSEEMVVNTVAATAPISYTSIARSMSRYKGGRRKVKSQDSPPPPVPTIGRSSEVQRSAGREDGYGPDLVGKIPSWEKKPDDPPDEPRIKEARSGKEAPPLTDRLRRASRIECRREPAPLENSNKSQARKYSKDQTSEKEGYWCVDTSQNQRGSTEKGDREMGRERRRNHPEDKAVEPQPVPSRSSRDQGGNLEQTFAQNTKIIRDPFTSGNAGSFSQRLAAQPQRPHAFRAGSSREELKRMISGPIPAVNQETAVSPPTKTELRINPSHPPTSPELSLAPRFDAPISAVNAGQRIVRVKYEGNDIFLPITPSTTPVDVIRAAARQLSAPIDERSTALLESFKQVGLERPLRRYEHIRDVLNSWDNDAQNALVIIASPSGGKDDDLDVRHVSKGQPGEITVNLYHSQKPGTWDKRWITLRSDGQIVVAKKRGSETTNICHLSDFDIYIPTPRYASKKINPPKKVCFAVKSQQKSSMFMTTQNFVHFFCTNDRSLGTSWYTAVQEWRSWYLVNVMGEGQKTSNEASASSDTQVTPGSGAPCYKPHSRPSVEGSSRIQNNAQPGIQPGTVSSPIRSRPVKSVLQMRSKKLIKDSGTDAHRPDHPMYQAPVSAMPPVEPFDPASLLGRTYTQKQKALQRSQAPPTDLPPPMPITAHRNNSPHRAEFVNGVKRHSSQRHKPKPLVDLTPVYQEPPQHSKKGRGVIPPQVPVGGLVEVATSPDNPIDVPSATTWRKPQT